MREHDVWEGPLYKDGINGQRVMIVGWSHWGDEAEDVGTIGCIDRVISGEWRNIRFFTQIRNYFGSDDPAAFWPQVAFFNFLPTLVGDGSQRFGHGTEEQREKGRQRFLKQIGTLQPKKMLVFTKRQWAFPPLANPIPLANNITRSVKCKYNVKGHETTAYFLRHPQGASNELMTRAVRQSLLDAR